MLCFEEKGGFREIMFGLKECISLYTNITNIIQMCGVHQTKNKKKSIKELPEIIKNKEESYANKCVLITKNK